MDGGYPQKFTAIEEFLDQASLYRDCMSVTDLGCSAGAVAILAAFAGYETVTGCDHDADYLTLLDTASKGLVATQKWSFGEDFPKADVVMMLALIHWVYSCTALYGSFTEMFTYLKPFFGKYFVVEWVTPDDAAIRFFKHTGYNPEVVKEEYNTANFEKGLALIGKTVDTFKVNGTRILYFVEVAR